MIFNPDLTKQAQKHLGLYLDQKLDFSKHINEKISKAQKGISVIKKFIVFCQEMHF